MPKIKRSTALKPQIKHPILWRFESVYKHLKQRANYGPPTDMGNASLTKVLQD